MPTPKPILDDALLKEIFRGMASEEGAVPSTKLLEALAKANGSRGDVLKDLYRSVYKDTTGEEDDPFGSADIIIG